MRLTFWPAFFTLAIVLSAATIASAQTSSDSLPSADEVVAKMSQLDAKRESELTGYTAVRRYPHPGRIIFADRQVSTQTGTIQIVGEFPNSKNLLRPGQYARVQAPTGSITGALLVPQAAVNQQQGTYQVAVVGVDNRAQLRTVEVGPRVGTLWVITSVLKPGERVVAVGAEKAKEGELANPTPYKETEER